LKFPRIYHLPYSLGATDDDKTLSSVDYLLNKPVVITEKMDGSNVCLCNEGVLSRGGSKATHPSFDLLKQRWAAKQHHLWRKNFIFGEWCYAKHSIHYTNLEDYFFMFAVFSEEDQIWRSWDDVVWFAKEFQFKTAPVLAYTNFTSLEQMISFPYDETTEGYVIRIRDSFHNKDFKSSVAKFVRANHVQTTKHWSTEKIIRNQLCSQK
jgi:hypothetical protein